MTPHYTPFSFPQPNYYLYTDSDKPQKSGETTKINPIKNYKQKLKIHKTVSPYFPNFCN